MAERFYGRADVSFIYKCQTFRVLFRGCVIKVLCYFRIQQMHVHVSLWVHLHVVVILAFLEVVKKSFMLEN